MLSGQWRSPMNQSARILTAVAVCSFVLAATSAFAQGPPVGGPGAGATTLITKAIPDFTNLDAPTITIFGVNFGSAPVVSVGDDVGTMMTLTTTSVSDTHRGRLAGRHRAGQLHAHRRSRDWSHEHGHPRHHRGDGRTAGVTGSGRRRWCTRSSWTAGTGRACRNTQSTHHHRGRIYTQHRRRGERAPEQYRQRQHGHGDRRALF